MAVACLAASAQYMEQSFVLKPGWNAFFLKVAPIVSPTELFSPLPVESVSLYSPESFDVTRQDEGSILVDDPVPVSSYFKWSRTPSASTMNKLVGDAVYICFNTGSVDRAFTVRGKPRAPRIAWHEAIDSTKMLNIVGLSLAPGAQIHPSAYFAGSNVGDATYHRLYGSSADAPKLIRISDKMKVSSDANVVFATSDTHGDWSGAMYISPRDGCDFGAVETIQYVTVRNDTDRPAVVEMSLRSSLPASGDKATPMPELKWCEASAVASQQTWLDLSKGTLAIAPGATRRISIALDRSQFDTAQAGAKYAAILHFEETATGSQMCADIPVEATVQSPGADAWPTGLWSIDAALSRVSRVIGKDEVVNDLRAGATANVRLYAFVDQDRNARLLQRVVVAGVEDSSGNVNFRLYAGDSEMPADATSVARLSSVVLPVDTPVIAGSGSFGKSIEFPVEVAKDSPSNPFRHPYHPNHDGLDWDFKTPLPDGDDFANYATEVKPELFSLKQVISLDWDAMGSAPWNPEETLTGTCSWRFKGLRTEGDIIANGRFRMTRIARIGKLEE